MPGLNGECSFDINLTMAATSWNGEILPDSRSYSYMHRKLRQGIHNSKPENVGVRPLKCTTSITYQAMVIFIISMGLFGKATSFELLTERSVKVVRGRNASLICSFTDPAHAVYWYKHNSTGAPDTDAELVASEFLGRLDQLPGKERFRITEDYRLLISEVSIADETTYSCLVVLQTGLIKRGYTDLRIIVLADFLGPRIGPCNNFILGLCTYKVPNDPPEEVLFACILDNVRPPVNLTWIRSDNRVMEQASGLRIVEKDGLYEVTSILEVPKSGFEYDYLCQATGDAVQNASSTKLTFEEGTVLVSGWSDTSVLGVVVGLVVVTVIAVLLSLWIFSRCKHAQARAKATKRYRLTLNTLKTDPESSLLDKQDGEQDNLRSLQGENVENEHEEERAKFEQEEKQSLESRLKEYKSELNQKELERVISKQRSQIDPSGIDSSELQEEGHATELSPMIDVRGGGTMSMSRRVVTRASLGRMANLGTLYDARTESFLNNNLFISGHEDSMMVDEMGLDKTEIEMTTCDSFHEICQDLDVEPELELSVAAGMVKLGGSGAYLGDERKSSTGQRMSLIYKLKTVSEEVMLRQNRDIIDNDKLADKYLDATHVVVGIDWGALCTIICVCENMESDKDTKVRKEIKTKLGALKNVLNANESAKARVEDMGCDDMRKFSFEYRSDVESSCPNIPETLEETLDHARNFLTKVKNTNNGRGVPVKYYLMPLATVRNHFQVKAASAMMYNEVHERSVRQAVKVYEIVQKNCQKVYDIHQDMTFHSPFITNEALERIELILKEVTEKESRFKSDLQEVVKKVRTDEERLDSFEEFLGKMKHEDISASNYVEIFEPHLRKARLIKSMTSTGIKYVGKQDVLVNLDAKPITHVFYIPQGGDSTVTKKNRDFFMRLYSAISIDEPSEFIVVDQEIVSRHVWPDKEMKPVIKKYVNGKLISNDLYEEEGKYLEMCMVQVCNPRPCTSRACTERAFAKLRCPNSVTEPGRCGCCQCMWRCSKCKQFVKYSTTSNLFHCKCGDSNPEDALFRCNDPHHGMNFMKYRKDLLDAYLSQLKPIKEYNILIVGEVGVGKSTFINAIYNYLSFANLSEAISSEDFHVLIPSSFSITKDGEQREINVGYMGDGNEIHEIGKSVTMKPKSYVFIDGDRRLRFIDTPGFGDCAGIKQDEINMKNILSYISYYSEIHAICFLLKPNNAQLTPMFRYCIQELLVNLHKSAKDNIVFCFTNACQTLYQPGDTLQALIKMLRQRKVEIEARKDKVFCFENESFRFIACTKNGDTFNNSEVAPYSASWDKSAEETKRLLLCIERMVKPHNVKETIGVIEARRCAINLGKQLAETAHLIDCAMVGATEIRREIALADTEIDFLREHLYFKTFNLKEKQLDTPRVVCAARECVEYTTVGQTKVYNTVYKTICHMSCDINSQTDTIENEMLYGCSAMVHGICRYCNHSYKMHMILTREMYLVEEEVFSPHVQRRINIAYDNRNKKQAISDELNRKIMEMKDEQNVILETGAKFESFLKANVAMMYDDALNDYLKMCFSQEESKPGSIRNEAMLESMKKMSCEYRQLKEIPDNATEMGSCEYNPTPEEVLKLQEKLFKLRHFGPILKNLFDEIYIEHKTKSIQEIIVFVPSSYKDS